MRNRICDGPCFHISLHRHSHTAQALCTVGERRFADETIPTTLLYPTLQGANLVASAILASILFRERITRKSVLGVSIALLAVLLMNL